MPVALPFPPQNVPDRSRSRIWIGDRDPEGVPVDPAIRDAAYQKEDEFFRFRRGDLPDDAHVAELIERSVYKASRRARNRWIEDPAGFLFQVFKYEVSTELAHSISLVGCDPNTLQHLYRSLDPEDQILRRVVLERFLNTMSPEGREAWLRRAAGWQVQEIAEHEGVTPDCLSTRLRRAAKEALERLRAGSRR